MHLSNDYAVEPNPGLPAWVDNLAKGWPVAHCPHQEVGAAADTLDCQQRERTPHCSACPTLLLLLCLPWAGRVSARGRMTRRPSPVLQLAFGPQNLLAVTEPSVHATKVAAAGWLDRCDMERGLALVHDFSLLVAPDGLLHTLLQHLPKT